MTQDALPEDARFRRMALLGTGLCALLLLLTLVIPASALSTYERIENYLAIHLLMEFFAVGICVALAVLAWHALDPLHMETTALQIFGFSIIAGLELLHSLTFNGMPALLGPADAGRSVFFWLSSRLFEILVFTGIALRVRLRTSRTYALLAALLVVLATGWAGSIPNAQFQGLFDPRSGTTVLKEDAELALCAGHFLAALLLWHAAKRQPQLYLLAAGAAILGMSEFVFIPFRFPSDVLSITRHVFLVTGYMFIYRAISVRALETPYRLLLESEAAVRQRESELQTVIDSLSFPAWLRSADGRLTIQNAASVAKWGALLGTVPEDMSMPPALKASAAESMRRALAGEVVSREGEYAADDGPHFYHGISAPVYSDGRISGIVGVNMDITERKRAELALTRNESLLRAFVKHIPAAVSMLDGDLRLLYVSDAWCRIFGVEERDVIGRRSPDIFPDVPERWRELQRRALAGEVLRNEAEAVSRPDGRMDWMHWEMQPWRKLDGSIGGLIVFNQIITQRVQAQQEIARLSASLEAQVLERTAELARVNADLEEFSASVSHDLRSPLRNIAGYLTLLQEEEADLGEEGRRHVAATLRETERASQLIEDLLDLARIGRADLDLQPVDLNELLRETLESVASGAPKRPVEWRVAPLPTVTADRKLLWRALLSLVDNALKFTAGRDPAVIQIGLAPDGQRPDEWVIFVRDNGVGFDPNDTARLFGAFQRLHSDPQFKGAGIGLARVKRIVQRHGGSVWAEGKPGAGACFYFSMPKRSP
jgi:PAS domain S-box-containing protein